jgi:hypothetical protein
MRYLLKQEATGEAGIDVNRYEESVRGFEEQGKTAMLLP